MVEENKPKTDESDAEDNADKPGTKVKKKPFSGDFFKVVKATLFVLAIISLIAAVSYMTIANLAIFKVLPARVSSKLPIINEYIQKIEKKEKRIQRIKEKISEEKMIKKIGQLEIDLEEEENVEDGGRRVPFLYKLRVIRNKIKEKELAEIWVDNIIVMRFYEGIGQNTPYIRAKYVVKKINALLNDGADFNQLMPVVEEGIAKAKLGDTELFRVRKEDAIFNNSYQEQLLYAWVNNLRVALSAAMLELPKFEMKQRDIAKKEKEMDKTQADNKAEEEEKVREAEAKKVARKAEEEQLIEEKAEPLEKTQRLKKIAAVYEKMDLEKIPPVFAKMKNSEVEDILMYLSDKKLTKLFVALPAWRTTTYYRDLIKGKTVRADKNFKRFAKVWEKIPQEDVLVLFKKLITDEKVKILRKLSVKKKAKILSAMPSIEATKYLKLLEKNP